MAVLLLAGLLAGLSPEQTVGSPTKGVGGGAQYLPVVSFDGTRFLLSWHDHRNGPGGEAFSVRYDANGAALDATPIRLTAQNLDSDTWGALYDGTNHVVSFVASGKVAISRVTPGGALLDPAGIVVHAGEVYSFPSIAFDGNNYLVVWTDGRASSFDVYGARVTKAGVVLDPGGFPIATSDTFETNPDVAFDGTSFVVVWQEDSAVLAGARVTSAGAVQARTQIHAAAEVRTPRIAGRPGGSMVVWAEGPPGSRRIRGVGYATGAAPITFAPEDADDEHPPHVTWDGAQYVVVWTDDRTGTLQPYGTRVTTAHVPLDPGGKRLATTTGNVWSPFLAAGGGGYLLSFIDDRANVYALYVSRLSATLDPVLPAGKPVLNVGDVQDRAAIAVATGGQVLVGYEAWHHTQPNVELASLATPATPATVTASTSTQHAPALATSGDVTLAVWEESDDLFGRRFRPDGTPIDAAPFAICDDGASPQVTPAVAFDGTDFVVAWRDGRMGSSGYALWAKRVPVAGMPVDACGFLVSNRMGDNQPPRIAGRGGTSVVVWAVEGDGVFATRVQGTAVLDATPLTLDTGSGKQPNVAAGSAEFLIVWRDHRRGYGDLFANRLAFVGGLRDGQGVPLVLAPSAQDWPSAAFDGTRYLVAWEDDRRGKQDVYATYVTPSLQVSDPYGFEISASPEEDTQPAVAAIGPGRFAVAFSRFDLSLGSRRLGVRTVTDLAQGVSGCALDADCASGFCAGGVCCGTACAGSCQTCSTGTCALVAMGTACRAAASSCDAPEVCDGAAAACPPDLASPDGLACAGGVCAAGVCQTGDAPQFVGAPTVALTCGQSWSYSRSGRAEVTGKGPFTFTARRADGTALPEGFTLDPMSGELAWTPKSTQTGAITVELKVSNADGFDTELVTFDVECDPRKYQAGCGVVDPAPFVAAALLWLLLSWARRAPGRAAARSRGSSSSRSRRR